MSKDSKPPIKLGTRVRYGAKQQRTQSGPWSKTRKDWRSVPISPGREGIVVGLRTKQNGERVFIGQDEGYGWAPDEYVRMYLVAYDMNTQHDLVLPDDCEEVE